MKGVFILRVEDTDLERSTAEAVDAIFKGLDWLGITADEGPYFQTKRFDLYREYAQRLLALGQAYRCYATPEELEAMREAQRARNEKPKYDGRFRPASPEPQPTELPSREAEKPFVIRFRAPQGGHTVFNDVVLGDVATPNDELEDLIIVRSDGTPTYNFCVVVDDIDMRITHVIRGSDHVSNTPKQVAIYTALGAPLPVFAHVPMILGEDKKKLSKRHGATSVIEYKADGYLPDAFVNYLVRLGWSHGDQEIFTRKELESIFNLESIGKSAAVFDFQKLRWVNSEHIKRVPLDELYASVSEFFPSPPPRTKEFERLLDVLRERSQTLKDMAESCGWFFVADDKISPEEKDLQKGFQPGVKEIYGELLGELERLEPWSETGIEEVTKSMLAKHNLGLGKLGLPLRLALTGTTASPPLYSIFTILGKNRTLSRLKLGLRFFESR